MADKGEDWRYQNSGIVHTSDTVASNKPPLPRLVGELEQRAQEKKEARAEKLGKAAFRLAIFLISCEAICCFSMLRVNNMRSTNQTAQIEHWIGAVHAGILVASCIVSLASMAAGRKTKLRYWAMFSPVICWLGVFIFYYGAVLLLHWVGIYPRRY